MKQLEEQRMCVKFCFKLGKTFVKTFELLKQAYREERMSHTQCYECFKRFKEGRTSSVKTPRPGQPSTSTDNCYVERVCEVIRGNRRLTVQEVAEEMGISIGSCHAILTRKLQMHRVSPKFVPHLLTDGQKDNRVSISQDMLANADADENFLKNRFESNRLFFILNIENHLERTLKRLRRMRRGNLRTIKQNAFQVASQKWKRRWKPAVGGDYFEGTVCGNDVNYLIKLFYSQFGLFLNTPRIF